MKHRHIASIPVVGIAACAVCCAIPFVAAAGVPAGLAALVWSREEAMVLVAGLAGLCGLAAVFYVRKSQGASCKAAACSSGCGCKPGDAKGTR